MQARKYVFPFILHLVMLAGSIIMIGPLIWGLLSAFKTPTEIIAVPLTFLPQNPTLGNFIALFSGNRVLFVRYFLNSTFVTIVVVSSNLFVSSLCGYYFAKFDFWGKNFLFILILSTMMIPFQLAMIPLFLMLFRVHLVDTYAGIIIPSVITPFGIFLMRQFIETIPTDLMDVARIDGCTEFRIFTSIVIPLAKPAIVAIGIFSFLWTWNDYLWPLIITTSNKMRTLSVGIASLGNEYGIYYGEVLAAILMSIAPVIIAYVVFQKHFVSGISLTGLKG